MSKRILVIEPSPSIRGLLHLALSQQGYRLISVASASAGLALLRRLGANAPDIIFLAVGYGPLTDELDMLALLRQSPYHQHSALVMITAMDSALPRLALLPTSRLRYLPKPFTLPQALELAALLPAAQVIQIHDTTEVRS